MTDNTAQDEPTNTIEAEPTRHSSKRTKVVAAGTAALVIAVGALGLVVRREDDSSNELVKLRLGSLASRDRLGSSEAMSGKYWTPRTYVLGDGVQAPTQNAPVYQLRATDNRERATKLAEAFDITGEWTCNTEWYFQRCAINDGSIEVTYSTDGSSSWSVGAYYAPVASDTVSSSDPIDKEPIKEPFVDPGATVEPGTTGGGIAESARTSDGSSDTVTCMAIGPLCDPAVELPTLPSDDEAITTAREVFEAAGYAFDSNDIKVERSDYNVAVSLVGLNDPEIALSYGVASINFSDVDTPPNAWGTFIDVDLLGDYPTLSAQGAIDQLNNANNGFGIDPRLGVEPQVEPQVEPKPEPQVGPPTKESDLSLACVAPQGGLEVAAPCTDGGATQAVCPEGGPAMDCASSDAPVAAPECGPNNDCVTFPSPETDDTTPVVVTLVDPKLTYWVQPGPWSTAEDGTYIAPTEYYLVPNYTFSVEGSEGEVVEVLALDPAYVQVGGDDSGEPTDGETTTTFQSSATTTVPEGDERVTSTTFDQTATTTSLPIERPTTTFVVETTVSSLP